MQPKAVCRDCGFALNRYDEECPLCHGRWEVWEERFAPVKLERNREQISTWLSQLPNPVAFDIVATKKGIRLRVMAAPETIEGALKAWASMTQHQTRWVKIETPVFEKPAYILKTGSILPNLVVSEAAGDPLLAIGGQLMTGLREGQKCGLRFWVLGKDTKLQDKVRALAAYSYGTESGVGTQSPNVWGARLSIWKFILGVGTLTDAIAMGMITLHLGQMSVAIVLFVAGTLIIFASLMGLFHWMQWRSVPKEILNTRITDTLMKTAIVAYGDFPQNLSLLAGNVRWIPVPGEEWPHITAAPITLPALEIASLISPPERGEGSGIFDREALQEVPAPPASAPLVDNPEGISIGFSVEDENKVVKVDRNGHGIAIGGSQSGKSTLALNLLVQLAQLGKDAPGMLVIDPHLSLADGLLQAINDMPKELRDIAIQRLRIISPDQEEVVPLNLLALPDYSWAANTIVQIGKRLWTDYWGPRMQAVLLGLFKIVHSANMNAAENEPKMGLIHTIYAAFNPYWRHQAFEKMEPYERIMGVTLDQILGQTGETFQKSWVTEVVAPIISKLMNVELSPWLFAAMHQSGFADVETWIKEKSWIIMRVPSGSMGREGAHLAAGVFYNTWEAMYRKVTATGPVPYYVVVDEVQEVGGAMKLDALLSEGAKFGARVFVLAQSLSMMRKIEGLDVVVQAMLANSSTQAFFTPSTEDAELIRDTLNLDIRYGKSTLDLTTLVCWLRARVKGEWQPPTTIRIPVLKRPVAADVHKVIREVIAAHPQDYCGRGVWQGDIVSLLRSMLPPGMAKMLDLAFKADNDEDGISKKTKDDLNIEAKRATRVPDVDLANTGF